MRCLAAVWRYLTLVLVSVIGLALSGSVFLLVRHWEDEKFETSLTSLISHSAPLSASMQYFWQIAREPGEKRL
jgi:hypothetical protein